MGRRKVKLVCPICGFKGKSLVSHVVNKHKMSWNKFLKLFPGTVPYCASTVSKRKKTCKINCTCKHFKGIKLTEKRKNQISKNVRGKKNPFYGKKHRLSTRNRMKRNHADVSGVKNPFHIAMKDIKFKKRMQKKFKGVWKKRKCNKIEFSKYRQKRSALTIQAYLDGKITGNKQHKSGRYKSSKFNFKFYYRSSYELHFIKLCEKDSKIKSLKPNAEVIKYSGKDNQQHRYLPDFLINDKIVVEIKPKTLINYKDNKIKHQRAKLHCRRNKLQFRIITEIELYGERKISHYLLE